MARTKIIRPVCPFCGLKLDPIYFTPTTVSTHRNDARIDTLTISCVKENPASPTGPKLGCFKSWTENHR